jgi:hypothetical protein
LRSRMDPGERLSRRFPKNPPNSIRARKLAGASVRQALPKRFALPTAVCGSATNLH